MAELHHDVISGNLSNLGWIADGFSKAYLKLDLSNLNIEDVTILETFAYLQEIDLSKNLISDVSSFSKMKDLLKIDLSHNKINKLLDFDPPYNLKVCDCSYNYINKIEDLSSHRFLCKLILDGNNISYIEGLDNCKFLRHLSLEGNQISYIDHLDNLPLIYLNLSKNCINTITNLQCLECLEFLDLSFNRIRSLEGLNVEYKYLSTLYLNNNEIVDLTEIEYLKFCKSIQQLKLDCNPLIQLPDYRLYIVFILSFLKYLDDIEITIEEKVESVNLFNPSLDYMASRDHLVQVAHSFTQPQFLKKTTQLSPSCHYTLLILIGLDGLGLENMAFKLAQELSNYFIFAPLHTTRCALNDEIDGQDFYFCSLAEFEKSVKQGKFLQSYSYHNNLYGLSSEVVEAIASISKFCLSHMELEGLLTLKKTHLRPVYFLVLPSNIDHFEQQLILKGIYEPWQISDIISRASFYNKYLEENQECFKSVITGDDIIEIYIQLRTTVVELFNIEKGEKNTYTINNESKIKEPSNLIAIENSSFELAFLSKLSEERKLLAAEAALSEKKLSIYEQIYYKTLNSVPFTGDKNNIDQPQCIKFPLIMKDINTIVPILDSPCSSNIPDSSCSTYNNDVNTNFNAKCDNDIYNKKFKIGENYGRINEQRLKNINLNKNKVNPSLLTTEDKINGSNSNEILKVDSYVPSKIMSNNKLNNKNNSINIFLDNNDAINNINHKKIELLSFNRIEVINNFKGDNHNKYEINKEYLNSNKGKLKLKDTNNISDICFNAKLKPLIKTKSILKQ